MKVVKMSNHGRITIPAKIRRKYDWKDGDKLIIIDHPLEGIKILPYLSEEQMKSVLDKETGIKIIKEISKERKIELKHEIKKFYQRDI